MRTLLAFVPIAALAGCDCSRQPSAASGNQEAPPATASVASAPARSAAARPLDEIVDDWLANKRDGVPERLVAALPPTAAVQERRLYLISEAEFAAKPPNERDTLRASVATRTSALLQIGRESLRRAAQLRSEGNADAARAMLEMLRGLGEANRGSEVMLVLNLAGQRLYEEAETALADLGSPSDARQEEQKP